MINLYNDDRFKDLIFELDDGNVLAHKCVVAVSNVEYFQKLFDKNLQMTAYKIDPITNMMIIKINDCLVAEFSYIIRFCYNIQPTIHDFFTKFSYDFDKFEQMISAADRFGCLELIDGLTWLANIFKRDEKDQIYVILAEMFLKYPSCLGITKYLLSTFWTQIQDQKLSQELLIHFFKLYDVEIGTDNRTKMLYKLLKICDDKNVFIELAKTYNLLKYNSNEFNTTKQLITLGVYPDILDKIAKQYYIVVNNYPLKLAYTSHLIPIEKYKSKLSHLAHKNNIHSIFGYNGIPLTPSQSKSYEHHITNLKFDENGYLNIDNFDVSIKYIKIYFYEID